MADEFWRWSAEAIVAAVKKRQVSCLEVVDSALDRIASVNPSVNAIVDLLAEESRADAARADAAIKRGDELGPLAGVPVAVKINIDFEGRPTTNGVAAFADRIAAQDSPVVAKLRKAGAIIVGRTNTPAMSFGLFTNNKLYGRTFSPWKRDITPGGSSGGAAAAVSTGMVPFAHGNDAGGSIRYPAYCCGILGIRPSFGRVPGYNGTNPAEPPIVSQLAAVNGPLARSIGDLRMALDAMSGHDPRDPWSVPPSPAVPRRAAPCKVAMLASLPGVRMDDEVGDALHTAARWLTDAGYIVEDKAPPGFAEASLLRDRLLIHEIRLEALSMIEASAPPEEVNEAHALLDATPTVDFDEFRTGLARRTTILREWLLFLEEYPLVLTPTTWSRPMRIDTYDNPVRMTEATVLELSPLHVSPLLGLPALAAPTGIVDGLPTGVQLMASQFQEERLFQAGRAIEQRCGALVPIDPR